MRIVTVEHHGAERLGVRTPNGILLPEDDSGPPTMESLLADVDAGLAALRAVEAQSSGATLLEVDSARVLAPVTRPPNIVCIGKNYLEHAAEEGADMPAEPLVFLKHTASIAADGQIVRWSKSLTQQVDWEAELAVVIGRRADRVSEQAALQHVLGYACLNDVTARDVQFGDGQWARGKSLATFCPMGPDLVTADEVPDPQALDISCTVNGRVMQQANTALMYHAVAKIISYVSQAFPLLPGDVVATGTPAGVGIFRDPPIVLQDGDVMAVEIEGLGRLVNTCRVED